MLLLLNAYHKSKSFYRLLVTFSWIAICGFANNASFSSYLGLLTWNAIADQCEAKLVHGVLLLYLVVMPRVRMRKRGSVFVCVCVCRLLQLLSAPAVLSFSMQFVTLVVGYSILYTCTFGDNDH